MNIDPNPVLEKNKRFGKFARDLHKVLSEIDRVPLLDTSFNALHDQMRKLHDVLDSYAKDRFFDVPDKVLLVQAFHKCLVDCQSAGVHKQVVLTLSKLFEFMGANLAKVLPLFITCVFTAMPTSAFQTLPDLRVLLWKRVLNLNVAALQPIAPSLLAGVLPHIDEHTEGGGKEASRIIDVIPTKLRDAQIATTATTVTTATTSAMAISPSAPELRPRTFYRAVWQTVRNCPALRAQALGYLHGHLPRSKVFEPSDGPAKYQPDDDSVEGGQQRIVEVVPTTSTIGDAVTRDALMEKLGGDVEEVLVALCTAARERAEPVINKLLEVLAQSFALHDDTVLTHSAKVKLLEAVLPLAATNKFSTLTRLFRWLYGGTDLAAAIAYYNLVTHEAAAEALDNLVRNHGVWAARSRKILSGDAAYVERQATVSNLRSVEASVFDVFVALQQREESESTFGKLSGRFLETVANCASFNTRTAADCARVFEAAPWRTFLDLATGAISGFITHDMGDASTNLVTASQSLLRRVGVLVDCVATHLAALRQQGGETAAVGTTADWEAAMRLGTTIVSGLPASLRMSEEVSTADLAAILGAVQKSLDQLYDGVLDPLVAARRQLERDETVAADMEIGQPAASGRRGGPRTHTTTDEAGEIEDDLVDDLAAAEAAGALQPEPPRTLMPLVDCFADAVARILRHTVALDAKQDAGAFVPVVRTMLRQVSDFANTIGTDADFFCANPSDCPFTVIAHEVLPVAEKAHDGAIVFDAMAFYGRCFTQNKSAELASMLPAAMKIALRAWDLMGAGYGSQHMEAARLLSMLMRWPAPELRIAIAEAVAPATLANCHRISTLFGILADSDPALLVDFADAVVMLLDRPLLTGHRAPAVGPSAVPPEQVTMSMVREGFLHDNVRHVPALVQMLFETLLVDGPHKPYVTSRAWASQVDGLNLFVQIVAGIAATLGEQFIEVLALSPPMTWLALAEARVVSARHNMSDEDAAAMSDSLRMPHSSLLGTLLIVTLRVVRRETGPRQAPQHAEVIDTHYKNWLVSADPETARSATFAEPLTDCALALLHTITAAMMSAGATRGEFASPLLHIADEAIDLLGFFVERACATPQKLLMDCLYMALRYLDSTGVPDRGASSSGTAMTTTSVASPQRPSSSARGAAQTLMPNCVALTCTGLYQAFAAELTHHSRGCGLFLQWSQFLQNLLPLAHSHIAATVEQLLETHVTLVCLISKHDLASSSARLLQQALDNMRGAIVFLVESLRRNEGRQPAPQSVGLFGIGLFGGAMHAAPAADRTANNGKDQGPLLEAHQKLRAALPSLCDVLVDLFRSLNINEKTSKAKATAKHVRAKVDTSLRDLLDLLLSTMEANALERLAINLLQTGSRRRATTPQILSACTSLAASNEEDRALVSLIAQASKHNDLPGLVRACTNIISSRKASGARTARGDIETECALLYFLSQQVININSTSAPTNGGAAEPATSAVSRNTPTSSSVYTQQLTLSSELCEALRELSAAVMGANSVQLALALAVRLLNLVAGSNLPQLDFKDPRYGFFGFTLTRVVGMCSERGFLDTNVSEVLRKDIAELGTAVWSKDTEGVVRLATAIIRDKLAPSVEHSTASRNEASLVQLLAALVQLSDGNAKALEVSSSLRVTAIPDLISKEAFFRVNRATLAAWRTVLSLVGHDKAVFDALMARATQGMAIKLTSAAVNQDLNNKGSSLKRLAFFVLSVPMRTQEMRTRINPLRNLIHDCFRAFSKTEQGWHESARYCFLLFRVVLFKVPQNMRSKISFLWSLIMPEAVRLIHIASDKLRRDHRGLPSGLREVVVEVLKTIDLAFVLAPNEVQPFRWLFVDDSDACTPHSYHPLLKQLAARGSAPSTDSVDGMIKMRVLRLVRNATVQPLRTTNGDEVTPLRPLFALPTSTRSSTETDVRTLAKALSDYSCSIEPCARDFHVDEDDEEEGMSQGTRRIDDVVDVQHIEWLLESDFLQTSVSGISDTASSIGRREHEATSNPDGALPAGDMAFGGGGGGGPLFARRSATSSHAGDDMSETTSAGRFGTSAPMNGSAPGASPARSGRTPPPAVSDEGDTASDREPSDAGDDTTADAAAAVGADDAYAEPGCPEDDEAELGDDDDAAAVDDDDDDDGGEPSTPPPAFAEDDACDDHGDDGEGDVAAASPESLKDGKVVEYDADADVPEPPEGYYYAEYAEDGEDAADDSDAHADAHDAGPEPVRAPNAEEQEGHE